MTTPTLINLMQMSASIILLAYPCREWYRLYRNKENHISLALLLTNLFIAAAAIVRLVQIAGGRAQTWGDVIVWILGGNAALVQFMLSRGWFLDN